MPEILYRNRRAVALSNEHIEMIVSVEGGHIAAIRDKASGVNPLWSPPWPSIEPSTYDPAKHPEYGPRSDGKLLCGILGHNVCLDLFGGPSEEEAAAGMTAHGEAPVNRYQINVEGDTLIARTRLESSGLAFERHIRLPAGARKAEITETVENLACWDRPIAWTQHVTVGPPFLECGKTEFRASATKSKVAENDFAGGKGYMKIGAEFNWPLVPTLDGGTRDMRVFPADAVSAGFSTHLMDPSRATAYFLAWSPTSKLALAYEWKQRDFPWLGIWEENHARTNGPWNGQALTRGMEFGVSPFSETRRQMIDRHTLFGVPCYRWAPARGRITVAYSIRLEPAESADALEL
jgi:hypothetical protein